MKIALDYVSTHSLVTRRSNISALLTMAPTREQHQAPADLLMSAAEQFIQYMEEWRIHLEAQRAQDPKYFEKLLEDRERAAEARDQRQMERQEAREKQYELERQQREAASVAQVIPNAMAQIQRV